MNSMTTFTCSECKNTQSLRGDKSLVFICTTCGSLLRDETSLDLPKRPIPADWSVIQIGSTGSFKGKGFEVIGRVRLQMQKEYKNYWCLWYAATKEYGWLIESFGFYALCPGSLFEMTEKNDLKRLKAGKTVNVSESSILALDEEDHCEGLSYTGELNDWSFYAPNFNIVHGYSNRSVASFFHISSLKQQAKFFIGEWINWESLELKNLNKSNEW
jgi:hypothetical protein